MNAHRLTPSGSQQHNESPYQRVWEGQGLCPCGDEGRGEDAIA